MQVTGTKANGTKRLYRGSKTLPSEDGTPPLQSLPANPISLHVFLFHFQVTGTKINGTKVFLMVDGCMSANAISLWIISCPFPGDGHEDQRHEELHRGGRLHVGAHPPLTVRRLPAHRADQAHRRPDGHLRHRRCATFEPPVRTSKEVPSTYQLWDAWQLTEPTDGPMDTYDIFGGPSRPLSNCQCFRVLPAYTCHHLCRVLRLPGRGAGAAGADKKTHPCRVQSAVQQLLGVAHPLFPQPFRATAGPPGKERELPAPGAAAAGKLNAFSSGCIFQNLLQ